MKIISDTHTIQDKAGVAVKPVLVGDKPVDKDSVIGHAPGTVLEMEDKAAQDLIDRGVARKYEPDHEDAPARQAPPKPAVTKLEDPQPMRATNSTDRVGGQPVAAGGTSGQTKPATTSGPSELDTGAGAGKK